MSQDNAPAPAGLRRRIGAFGIDYLVILAYIAVLVGAGALVRLLLPEAARVLFGSALSSQLTGFLSLTVPVSLYFIVSEAGDAGATWGKRRLGMRVLDGEDRSIGIGRSIARTGLKFLPWELSHTLIWQLSFAGGNPPAVVTGGFALVWAIVGANLLSVLLDRQRRALYDRLAGTRVVRRS